MSESQPRKTMYTYRGTETPVYHTSQIFIRCHTLCPGMNVQVSKRIHSVEYLRELDGLVSRGEASDESGYIGRTYLSVTKCDALMQYLVRHSVLETITRSKLLNYLIYFFRFGAIDLNQTSFSCLY